MAAGAVPRLRCLVLLGLTALSCLQAIIPAATSQPRPLEVSTGPTPLVLEAAAAAAAGNGQQQQASSSDAAAALRARACTYTVKVKTSCASPARASTDAVSLAFGDAYQNEVYVAQLTPRYGFERCATDTFRVSGPCGYGVCYLYLRRAGRAGWAPEWVRVFEPASSTPSTFYYGDPIPAGVWYGFNRCVRRTAADDASSSDAAAAKSM